MKDWLGRLRRQPPPPSPIAPNLGTIVFTDGDTYPVTGLALSDGCVSVKGKLLAKDYGQTLPINVSVGGEFQVRDPSGGLVMMGWTERTRPMFMSAPDDSYEVGVSIGPIGTTNKWFEHMAQVR